MTQAKILRVRDGEYPWLPVFKFPYHPSLVHLAKGSPVKSNQPGFPGARWLAGSKEWVVPFEVAGDLVAGAKKRGYEIDTSALTLPVHEAVVDPHPKLYPFQVEGVEFALANDNALIRIDMGLGKTAIAIEWLKQSLAVAPLIVCPAMARKVWENELELWGWEGKPVLLKSSKDIEKADFSSLEAFVVSYSLLYKLPPIVWDRVIFDEIHYLAYPNSQRSQAATELVTRNPQIMCLGLTGTPIFNQIDSLWNPLSTIFPGRFGVKSDAGNGVPWKWKARYMETEFDDMGYTVYQGINEDFADELKARIRACSFDVSKSDPRVKGLLPPMLPPQVVYVENKVSAAKTFVQDAGASHTLLFTHLRQTAKDLADTITDIPTFVVTGASTPEKRFKLLEEAKACETAVICATIDSTREAIDLTFCTNVGFVELPWTPLQLLQALGRVNRLSGSEPVSITVFAQEEGDPRAEMLAAKIEVVATLISSGSEAKLASEALGAIKDRGGWASQEDFEDFLKMASDEFGGGW